MACRSSASSAPARTFAVPPYGAKTSPRFSSCAIPFAASAAVSARWSVTPSPACLCHPASNPGAGIALLTHPSVGSISPGIPTPPILCYPRTPEKNHTPVGNLRSESKLKSKMDIPNSFLVEAVILNGVKDGGPCISSLFFPSAATHTTLIPLCSTAQSTPHGLPKAIGKPPQSKAPRLAPAGALPPPSSACPV
jgi:hypothetical protein